MLSVRQQWDWKSWLETSIGELAARKSPALIIDLRGNEGGLDIGDVLLSHLIANDLPLDEYVRKVRYRKAPAALVPYLDTWDESFLDWGADAVDLHDGFYFLKGDEPTGPKILHAKSPRLTARVLVLVDASNSSATFQLTRSSKSITSAR